MNNAEAKTEGQRACLLKQQLSVPLIVSLLLFFKLIFAHSANWAKYILPI
jgi:hypothetical protein